jgi:predicted glycosyltransferase
MRTIASAMTGFADASAPRFLLYCHDSIGLGHVRRAHVLGQALQARWPAMVQLLVIGLYESPLFAWPAGTDYVKLPSIRYVGRGRGPDPWTSYLPSLSLAETRAMRRDILLTVARHFRPDVFLVGHLPAGQGGELLPTLGYLRASCPHTRLILGMRDIMDEAGRLREMWTRDGAYAVLDQLYDLILVYGQREIYDLAEQAALPAPTAAKLRYVGYLRRQPGPPSPAQLRRELNLGAGPIALVAVGGGVDGFDLLQAALEAADLGAGTPRDLHWVLVSGPLMPAVDRERLKSAVRPGTRVRVLDSVDDLTGYIAAADVVVSRAGYNSVCEILSFDRPAVLVPRVRFGVEENLEQLIRAEAFSRRGLVRMLHPKEMTPARLLAEVVELLGRPRQPMAGLDMDGVPAAVTAIAQVLERTPR